MSSPHTSIKSAFTLVEMLIVIVIIGILAAALIPRLTGIQARARDTARDADLRNVATAIETYKADNGSYPIPVYSIAAVPRQVAFQELFIPSVFAQTAGSSLDTLGSSILGSYLKSLPSDPNNKGLRNDSSGNCIAVGNSYAYHSDGVKYYAITSFAEAKKGNASSCGDMIDRDKNGGYKKEGQGLNIDITDPLWAPTAHFTFNNGVISAYNGPGGNVIIPATIRGVSVTSIGDAIFQGKNLTSVIIPDSVTIIGTDAFSFNHLTSIIIPNSVTIIRGGAFYNNQLTSVVIPNSVTSIGYGGFMYNNLTSVTVPNSLTSIGWGTFMYNGPNGNSDSLPISSIAQAYGTRNLSGTTWVKQ